MDVRPDAGAAARGADQDKREGGSDDHEFNLRDLAMAVGEEAGGPTARKPAVADASSPKGSAASQKEEKPSGLPKQPSSECQPPRSAASTRQEEKPAARPKLPPADAPSPRGSAPPRMTKTRRLRQKRLPPSLWSDPRTAAGRNAVRLAETACRRRASETIRATAAQRSSTERPHSLSNPGQPLKPAALASSGGLAQSKGLVILAVVTAILIIVAAAVSFSGRPESVMNEDTTAPRPDSKESGNSAVEALPPPV